MGKAEAEYTVSKEQYERLGAVYNMITEKWGRAILDRDRLQREYANYQPSGADDPKLLEYANKIDDANKIIQFWKGADRGFTAFLSAYCGREIAPEYRLPKESQAMIDFEKSIYGDWRIDEALTCPKPW